MCYAIPGKIIDSNGNLASIEYFGEIKKARNDFFELSPGDYVYAQGGFVIQKMSRDEALSSLEAWKELFFELKKIDNRLSRAGPGMGKISKETARMLNKARRGAALTKQEALALFNIEDAREINLLFKTANSVRQKFLSNACCVHGIIEFSYWCVNDCLYCGIRSSNKTINRYRMAPAEIIESVKEAYDLGFKALVLQSGEDGYYTDETFERLIRDIRKDFPVLILLSAGEKGKDFYKRAFDAGARGVLFRFETSQRSLYSTMKPGRDLESRIEALRFFKKTGFLIATGGLLGLPGQKKEDMIEDIFLAKSFGADMYSFGPFIPHPGTPLKEAGIIPADDILKFIAVTRLIAPDAKILVTTALETIGADMRRRGLLAGANSFMLNATPETKKMRYEIYKNRAGLGKDLRVQVAEALALLKELGRAPTDLGYN